MYRKCFPGSLLMNNRASLYCLKDGLQKGMYDVLPQAKIDGKKESDTGLA